MSEAGIAGSPPQFPVYPGNVVDLVFDDSFVKSSPWVRHGPSGTQGHAIPSRRLQSKVALVEGATGASISYQRLRLDVLRLACGLRSKLDLFPVPFIEGDPQDPLISPVVLIHLPNCIPFVVCQLATWAAGLTVTTVNFAYRAGELAHVIQTAKPSVIITLTGGLDAISSALRQVDIRTREVLSNNIFLVDLAAEDYASSEASAIEDVPQSRASSAITRDWKWLLVDAQSTRTFQIAFQSRTDREMKRRAALILWSSGTTGTSKGVVISHPYLAFNIQTIWYHNPDLGGDEVFLGLPPFFHIFGLSNVLLVSLALGGTTICLAKFDPATYLSLMQQYRVTHLHVAAPVAVLLAKSPMVANYDFSSVRSGTSGGAPVAPSIIGAVAKRLGFLIKMSFGSSECASATQTYAMRWEELASAQSATGQPYGGVEIKVVSIDGSKKVLERGREGEICVRSPSIMICYLNNPQATASSRDAKGWFYTGDVGYLDKNSNLYITDRLKELIKVKGYQVAPAELEGILSSLDSVADAGVTSIYADDDATEYPRAYVVPSNAKIFEECTKSGQPTDAAILWAKVLKQSVEEKLINYKWLRGGIMLVDAIPKSNSGKLLRKDLKHVQGFFIPLYAANRRHAKL